MIGSGRFQNGSLTLVKNKTKPHTWFLRFYEEVGNIAETQKRRLWSFAETSTTMSVPRRP